MKFNLEQLDLLTKYNLTTNNLQKVEEFKQREILEPCYLMVRDKKVYLTDYKIEIEIGRTNIKKLEIKLKQDPTTIALHTLGIAAGCCTKETASNSPSMILHQTASLSLIRSLPNNCIFESKGTYSADIVMQTKVGDVNIDITGPNLLTKLNKMPKRSRNISINKYRLINPIGDLAMIYKYSIANDGGDMSTIYENVSRLSEIHGLDMFYDLELLNFFSTHKDSLNRSIMDHYHSASNVIKEKIKNDLQDHKAPGEFEVDVTMYSKQIKAKIRPLDISDVFIFNSNYGQTFEEKFVEEDIEYSDSDIEKHVTVINGILDLVEKQTVKNVNFFEKLNEMRIHQRAFESVCKYPIEKMINEMYSSEQINHLLYQYKSSDKVYLMLQRSASRMRRVEIGPNGLLQPRVVKSDLKKGLSPIARYFKVPFTGWSDLVFKGVPIDPDHLYIINRELETKEKRERCIKILSSSRDYHDLRFRAKLSQAILITKRSGKGGKLISSIDKNKHAEFMIKGMILERDSGVVYVSYFERDMLVRTEKWRIPDIENYTVGHMRAASLATCLSKLLGTGAKDNLRYERACLLYFRILSENSWGLSRILKPFRYLTTGYLVKSPMIDDQFDKMIKEIPDDYNKASLWLLADLMQLSNGKGGRTLVFNFTFNMIGWEAFLLNLCPNKTYGQLKHMIDIYNDIVKEVDLYDSNKANVEIIYNDFKHALTTRDLDQFYRNHFKLIDKLAIDTDYRFTFSPASIILIYNELQKINVKYEKAQGMLPHITELMTARSSYDTYSAEKTIALKSIRKLVEVYKTSSTSLLGLKILNKEGIPDLMMWLFDKFQTGGNREISVLTGEFRVLQVISERFFEGCSKYTTNEMLHRPEKEREFAQRIDEALRSITKFLLTADQTRWGPNFNTCTFGFLALAMFKFTTEAYVPAWICLLSEFKVFESPIYLAGEDFKFNSGYTIPGLICRSHMGQGIFHTASSFYHSLVISTTGNWINELLNESNPFLDNPLIFTSMVTSDDVGLTHYVPELDPEKSRAYMMKSTRSTAKELKLWYKNIETTLRIYYSDFQSKLTYFGIKTSSYKNWISDNSIEFNSIFLSDKGIGSNDLKFIYSMIDPGTTGNFINDYYNSINVYYQAANSNCDSRILSIMTLYSYSKFLRQWKISSSDVGFPNETVILMSNSPTYLESNSPELFRTVTPSTLHFRLRGIEDLEMSGLNDYESSVLKYRFSQIHNTRGQTSYRSCLTYCENYNIINFSKYFKSVDALGETFESYLYNANQNHLHHYMILNSVEKPYSKYLIEKESNGGIFDYIYRKVTHMDEATMEQIILGTFGVKPLINSESSDDEIFLHLMRGKNLIDLSYDPYNIKDMTIPQAILYLAEREKDLMLMGGNSSSIVYNDQHRPFKYIRLEIQTPYIESFYQLSTLIEYGMFHYDSNYNSEIDYVAFIEMKDGKLYTKKANSNKSLVYDDRRHFAYRTPRLMDLISSVTSDIYEEDIPYRNELGEIYINYIAEESAESESKDTSLLLDLDEDEERDLFKGMSSILDDLDGWSDIESGSDADDALAIELDLTSKTVNNAFSAKVDLDYSLFMSDYMSSKVILNHMIQDMIDEGVICLSVPRRPKYILREIGKTIGMQTTCKNLDHKLNSLLQQVKSSMRKEDVGQDDEWIRLALAATSNQGIIDDEENIRFKLCLLTISGRVYITSSPSGKVISRIKLNELIKNDHPGIS